MRRALLLAPLLVAGLAAGCGDSDRKPMPVGPAELTPPPGGWDYEFVLGREGPLRGTLRGVRFEIERGLALGGSGLEKAQVTGYTKRGIGDPDLKIRGQDLRLADGRLRIGETAYGEVAAGELVVIDASGVQVDGEPRGSLPGS